jgi:hypothetical protein
MKFFKKIKFKIRFFILNCFLKSIILNLCANKYLGIILELLVIRIILINLINRISKFETFLTELLLVIVYRNSNKL